MTKRRAGYRNLNRAKSGKAEQLSIGRPQGRNGLGLSGPKLQGYTSSGVFLNATFVVVPSIVQKVLARQVKSVCAWIVGEWVGTPVIRQSTLNGRSYDVYAPNPDAVPVGREISINPKSSNPTLRVFHYRDTLETVDTSRRYRVVWTADHHCYIT